MQEVIDCIEDEDDFSDHAAEREHNTTSVDLSIRNEVLVVNQVAHIHHLVVVFEFFSDRLLH